MRGAIEEYKGWNTNLRLGLDACDFFECKRFGYM
jgi:hypothetical protein